MQFRLVGVLDLVIVPGAWPTLVTYIGARNSAGVADRFITSQIRALIVCDDVTAFGAPDIAAIAALPVGSMHNL